MERIVSSPEMREVDLLAMEKLGLPGMVLMENAGRGVVDAIELRYGPLSGKHILILCGKGNNGGDGMVVARHALIRGARVTVGLLARRGELKGDAKANWRALVGMLRTGGKSPNLDLIHIRSISSMMVLPTPDVLVDALFGTGFSGAPRGLFAKAILWINQLNVPRVSIDVPSGLSADTSQNNSLVVRADMTLTMGFKKQELLLGISSSYTGLLKVVDIGVAPSIIPKKAENTWLVDREDVAKALPLRAKNSHKYNVGKVFVLAGSRGLTGAAAMAASAALFSGAGAVVLGVPEHVYSILAKKLTEVIVLPMPSTEEGTLALSAMSAIEQQLDWADVVLIGPGLSRQHETEKVVRTVLARTNRRMVVDADALNALSSDLSLLKRRKPKSFILTPHAGELSRLIRRNASEIDLRRVEVAREYAREWGVTLVLKGSPTSTATRSGQVYLNSTGNPGMATAGSGDVLAGVIAGLWSQGMTETEAAYAGVFLHGKAGDLARDKFGERGMLASDIEKMLPQAFLESESTSLR